MSDTFDFWRAQMAGKNPPLPPRAVAGEADPPQAGYYRTRDGRSVAFWLDGEEWLCAVSSGYQPTKGDQMEELFGSVCRNAVSYEDYQTFQQTGRWADTVTVDVSAPAADDERPLNEKLNAEMDAKRAEILAWLKELGHPIQTQKEADRAANFAAAFGKIETAAEKAREAEKDEFLKAGRAIDEKWKAVKDRADKAKTWTKSLTVAFIEAETARRAAEAKAENERVAAEHAAAVAAAEKEKADLKAMLPIGVDLPKIEQPKAPPKEKEPERVKIGTGPKAMSAREQEIYEITDQRALLAYLSTLNTLPARLLDAALDHAEMLARGGMEVPGIKMATRTKVV